MDTLLKTVQTINMYLSDYVLIILLLGAGLRVLQKLHSLHTGAEQFKVHGLVIRHGAHPLCISVGSLPRSLRPDTPELFSQTMTDT